MGSSKRIILTLGIFLTSIYSYACSCLPGVIENADKLYYFEVVDKEYDQDGWAEYSATILVYRVDVNGEVYENHHVIYNITGHEFMSACGYELKVGESYVTTNTESINICNTRGLGKFPTRVLAKNF